MGWTAGLRVREMIPNEVPKPVQCRLPVCLLTAGFLRLDDDNAVGSNPLVLECQESLLDGFRQSRGCTNIVMEVNGTRHFVDVLAAGAATADSLHRDLFERNRDGLVDLEDVWHH